MRALFLLPFALACTPEGASLEPWHGDDDGTPYLGDDLDERFELTTRLYGEPGEARLTHAGPPLGPRDEVWTWPSDLSVVETADDLRVAWEGGGVQLLLWLPRAELVDAVATSTVGFGRPGAMPDTPGLGQVTVPGGTEVDLSQAEGDHVLVEWEAWTFHSSVRITAWVHLGDVDQAWLYDPFEQERTGHDAWVDGPILDQPHGEVLAVSADDEAAVVVDRTGEQVNGWWPVVWSDSHSRVEGWVYDDDLTPIDGMTFGWGSGCSSCCGGFGWFSSSDDIVPANTPLRTGRDGPIVARTMRDLVVPGFDDGGAFHVLDTPWGAAELWADPLDVLDPEDPQAL